MTTGGWIFLALSWGFSLWLVIFCFKNIFKEEKRDASPNASKAEPGPDAS